MDKTDKTVEETKYPHTCGCKTQIFSRVTGYYRPIDNWNKGKREEFNERKKFNVTGACSCCAANN